MLDNFDRRIHYLRISVTDRCNLRCAYCMPPEGIPLIRHEDVLSFEEITAFTRRAVELGVDKVRLTGGEPLVRRGVVSLVQMLSEIAGIKDLAMTTNGILLTQYAVPLRQAGLGRINISLDTLDPVRFRELTRGGDVAAVLRGIDAAMTAGLTPVKLNCVIQQSPDEADAQAVTAYAQERLLEVRYIRQMNMRSGSFWTVVGGTGGECCRCNRLRLTSDGRLLPCLFSDLSFGVRELGIDDALRQALAAKPETGQHSRTNSFITVGG